MWSVTTCPCASLTSIETERASAEARPTSAGDEDQPGDVGEGRALVGRLEAGGDGVDDELDHVETGQRQDALDDGERDRRQRPAGRDAPHEAQGPPEVQDAAHADPGCLLSQYWPPSAGTPPPAAAGGRDSTRPAAIAVR